MTDDELYENMILQESRFQELKDYLKGASYSTGYYDDY
jgi:hypothetical protein